MPSVATAERGAAQFDRELKVMCARIGAVLVLIAMVALTTLQSIWVYRDPHLGVVRSVQCVWQAMGGDAASDVASTERTWIMDSTLLGATRFRATLQLDPEIKLHVLRHVDSTDNLGLDAICDSLHMAAITSSSERFNVRRVASHCALTPLVESAGVDKLWGHELVFRIVQCFRRPSTIEGKNATVECCSGESFPEAILFDLIDCTLDGISVKCPHDSAAVLASKFGVGWETTPISHLLSM